MRKLAVGLLLAGCAQRVWVRQGSTTLDFKRDNYACAQESRTSWGGGGTGIAGAAAVADARGEAQRQADGLYDMCMEARGWHVEERGGGGALAAEVMFPPRPVPPPKVDPNWGFTGDACGDRVSCQPTFQCVDGRCAERR